MFAKVKNALMILFVSINTCWKQTVITPQYAALLTSYLKIIGFIDWSAEAVDYLNTGGQLFQRVSLRGYPVST